MSRRAGLSVLISTGIAGAAVALLVGPIPQDPAYHGFADERMLWGISNALDVLSNVPFLIVGLWGLRQVVEMKRQGPGLRYVEPWELVCLSVMFGGIALVALGSSWYHLVPDNPRLVWDRIPMTIAFTSLFALVLGDRFSMTVGRFVFVPLVLLGVLSVVTWIVGESQGAGDLRFYGFIQFYPMATIPLLLLLPATYTRGAELFAAVGWYLLAKLAEIFDVEIFAWSGVVSGHTIKHLLAAAATAQILHMVVRRRTVTRSN